MQVRVNHAATAGLDRNRTGRGWDVVGTWLGLGFGRGLGLGFCMTARPNPSAGHELRESCSESSKYFPKDPVPRRAHRTLRIGLVASLAVDPPRQCVFGMTNGLP